MTVKTNKQVIQEILKDPTRAANRTKTGIVTYALFEAANKLPEGHEKTALFYLARNPEAFVILDRGDTVVTNALKEAIKLM